MRSCAWSSTFAALALCGWFVGFDGFAASTVPAYWRLVLRAALVSLFALGPLRLDRLVVGASWRRLDWLPALSLCSSLRRLCFDASLRLLGRGLWRSLLRFIVSQGRLPGSNFWRFGLLADCTANCRAMA